METCRQTPASRKIPLLPKVSDAFCFFEKIVYYYIIFIFIFWGSKLFYFLFECFVFSPRPAWLTLRNLLIVFSS